MKLFTSHCWTESSKPRNFHGASSILTRTEEPRPAHILHRLRTIGVGCRHFSGSAMAAMGPPMDVSSPACSERSSVSGCAAIEAVRHIIRLLQRVPVARVEYGQLVPASFVHNDDARLKTTTRKNLRRVRSTTLLLRQCHCEPATKGHPEKGKRPLCLQSFISSLAPYFVACQYNFL